MKAQRVHTNVSGAKSTAWGSGLRAASAGCVASFTVTARDAEGHTRGGGGDVVVVRLLESDGTVASEGHVVDNTDGTHLCSYVPTAIDGAPRLLHVTVNGQRLQGSPFRPDFQAGPVSARHCTATGSGVHDGVTGQPVAFRVRARDSFGNALRGGGARFVLRVVSLSTANPEYASYNEKFDVTSEAVDHGDGTYAFEWSANLPGEYEISVTLDHEPIRGAPFRCCLTSPFLRPPAALAPAKAVVGEGEGERPEAGDGRAAAVVGAQLVVVGSMVPRRAVALPADAAAVAEGGGGGASPPPAFTIRRPAVHLCQLGEQFAREPAYIRAKLPECRWRSALLGTAAFPPAARGATAALGRQTLVPAGATLYVLSHASGDGAPLAALHRADLFGGSAAPPPAAFKPIPLVGAPPAAVDGYCAAFVPGIETAPNPSGGADGGADGADGGEAGEGGGGGGGGIAHATVAEGEGEGEGAEAVELMPSTAALYVFGGTADGGALVGDLCRVDADGGAWALVGDGGRGSLAAPSARAGAAMAADDANVLWLFGGRTAAGWSSETFTLDTAQLPATDAPLPWASPELGGAAPAPREGHAMAWLCGRYLAVVGGSSGGAPLDEFALLDALTLTWHVRAAPSLARVGVACGYACGSLLVFGGVDAGGGTSTKLQRLRVSQFPQQASLSFTADATKYVCIKPTPALGEALLNCVSVEAWVRPSAFAANAPVLCKCDGGMKTGFGLVSVDEAAARKIEKEKGNGDCAVEALPTIAFFVVSPAEGIKRATARVEAGAWTQVTGTWDGNCVRLFVNGVLADEVACVVAAEEMVHSSGDVFIGALPNKAAWDGLVDEVRLWTKPIVQEDIRRHFNEVVADVEEGLVGQWSFNEGGGEVCCDTSGAKHHGTIEGGAARVQSTREWMQPELTESEKLVDANFQQLKAWKAEFEKSNGRPPSKADILLADKEILNLARRLGDLG